MCELAPGAPWNATARAYPRDASLAALFEAQVARTPDAEAVVFGAERLDYRGLDARANRLARRLRRLGVEVESRVGLYLERSATGAFRWVLCGYPTDASAQDAGMSRSEFEDLVYQQIKAPGTPTSQEGEAPIGLEAGLGARVVASARNFGSGNLRSTNGPLDFAVEGQGFFQLTLPTPHTPVEG